MNKKGIIILSLIPILGILSLINESILKINIGLITILYFLITPGFLLTCIFFEKKEEINLIERLSLSLPLGMIVPIIIFYLNLIGIKINLVNSSLIVLGIILIMLYVLNKKSINF